VTFGYSLDHPIEGIESYEEVSTFQRGLDY